MRIRPLAAAAAAAIAVAGAPLGAAAEQGESRQSRDLSFVVVPIPVSNPAIGNGVALVAGALYKASGSERPWVTGAGGAYTETSSWAAAVFQKAYLSDDRFRLTAGAGGGVFNVDFFGTGQEAGSRGRAIPIQEEAKFGLAEGLIRVGPNLYAGFEYRVIDMNVSVDLSQLPFADLEIPTVERNSRTSALGLAGEYDTRDSELQPTKGLYANGTWLWASERLGGDFDYGRGEFAVNGYRQLDPKSIVAWRVSTCRIEGGAPFYDLCSYGSSNDLRGYTAGQYIDKAMYAVQAEYRRHLFGRFGAVAFAGVGEVGESFDKLSTRDLLPAAGVGLRFLASRRYGVNVSIDYARGKRSDGVYFYVGEAF